MSSDKASLLPVANACPPPTRRESQTHSTLETTLFYVCISTLMLLFGSLYYKDSLPSWLPLAPTLHLLHAGMLSSLWASLPAPALLFVFAPCFADKDKVTMVRYWIYLFYIVGVAVGAMVFGSEANAMQCAMH